MKTGREGFGMAEFLAEKAHRVEPKNIFLWGLFKIEVGINP